MKIQRVNLLILLSLTILQISSFFGIAKVDGTSMNNTLQDGSYHVYIKSEFHQIERGDIILCYVPSIDEYVVKRVIGIPSDSIRITDGDVFVNGNEFDTPSTIIPDDSYDEAKLGLGQYYVLGDNRPDSVDSRIFGKVQEEDIVGVLVKDI